MDEVPSDGKEPEGIINETFLDLSSFRIHLRTLIPFDEHETSSYCWRNVKFWLGILVELYENKFKIDLNFFSEGKEAGDIIDET